FAAVSEAVENGGVGLLIRQGFGDARPGYTAENCRLHGLEDARMGSNDPWRNPAPSAIVGQHPILGKLSGQTQATFTTLPQGAFGTLSTGSIPLIRVTDINQINPGSTADRADWAFYPLYVSTFGRGAIVVCNFNVHAPPP